MHLCMWSLLSSVWVRGVVEFVTSLTSTPHCDPIWSSAVCWVWANAAGISFTWECAYGCLTSVMPLVHICILQTLERSRLLFARAKSAPFPLDFQCGLFFFLFFLFGSWSEDGARSCSTTAVRCGLAFWWIFTTACFRWRRPGCWELQCGNTHFSLQSAGVNKAGKRKDVSE